ncbi:hypothetical protein K3495_g3875 [Podosphaera aphanis]|nr:hypothetical protein K3495_g3875 [Podosphaera aphanis]
MDRQQTSSYWANHRSIFSEPVQSQYQQTSAKSPQRTQGQHNSQHDPPTTPDIPTPEIFNPDPSSINNQREDTPAPTSPHLTVNSPLTPHEGSSVTQYHPVSDATSAHTSQDSDLQIVPYSRPYEDQREIIAVDEVSENNDSSEDEHYDQIMTGWNPIPQTAGTKRPNSPDHDTMITQRGRMTKRVDYNKLHRGMAAIPSTDPQTWEEAMTGPESSQWRKAATKEFDSLQNKGAIEIINRSQIPQNRKPMKCKWVFKKKYLANGDIEKYKARCTAKGFTQRHGIDYKETFSPTPRPETGRIMLVLAHQLSWHRRQGDVPTAFLNPNLDIELFMELPKGFEREGCIIKLHKGLCGLKQAAALWYDDAKATLASQGLFPTTSDVCLYTTSSKDIFVLLHVDDFQVMGPNLSKIESLMHALQKKYNLKTVNTDLFLGIEIKSSPHGTLKISQGQYARTLINRHGLSDCKVANSPIERLMENNQQCSQGEKTKYNSCIGGLQYLANNTRPDIAFAVNHLARFLANPSKEHSLAARRVLRYIAKDPDQGINFTKAKGKAVLEAYSDADFAADPSNSRSTSGTLIRLASGPVRRGHGLGERDEDAT